jgi:hypothetical protein
MKVFLKLVSAVIAPPPMEVQSSFFLNTFPKNDEVAYYIAGTSQSIRGHISLFCSGMLLC